MKEFTYAEAKRNLASALDIAKRDGAVKIRRRNGQAFILTPSSPYSPASVTSVGLGMTRDEIASVVREGRERDYWSPYNQSRRQRFRSR